MQINFFVWERATTRVAPYYTRLRAMEGYIVGCDPCGRPLVSFHCLVFS